jgi:phosphoglycerate dehydrogenase-like enzyme
MKIVFQGHNARSFRAGIQTRLPPSLSLVDLPDLLTDPADRAHYASADVVVGVRLDASMPRPEQARLFHAPAAGTDGIDLRCLPAECTVCNCFGHEYAIAEYVMAALLLRHVPLARADADLREQRWTYYAGHHDTLRTELGDQTLGVLGFGHIGQAVAARAKAFGMRVHAANRSPIHSPVVDRAFGLSALDEFMASVDAVVVTLPLADTTRGLVGSQALLAMRPHAVLVNVGRGAVVDESALFDALQSGRLVGAIIDTWYQYPDATRAACAPSRFDFASLPNVLMTPHMSGWTHGTVRRRQQTLVDNITRLVRGEPLLNVVRAAA